VMAFNRPQQGRILVDGRDLTTVPLRDYRGNLGVVLQDNFLFDGTIAENIAYARPHASREDIKAVSRIAHCDDFVEAFEQGYDTIVGERGVRLSGGQRQRVAIARALVTRPAIVLADEPTANLDSDTGQAILELMRAMNETRRTTFIFSTHDPMVMNFGRRLVRLHDGAIAADERR